MTVEELLWAINGNVMLEVLDGLSRFTIRSIHGGGTIAHDIRRFPGLNPDVLLKAPARITEPTGEFTTVTVEAKDIRKNEGV